MSTPKRGPAHRRPGGGYGPIPTPSGRWPPGADHPARRLQAGRFLSGFPLAIRGSNGVASCWEFTRPKSRSIVAVSAFCPTRGGFVMAMELPDEVVSYQYQSLLAPAVEDWTPAAELRARHFLPTQHLKDLSPRLMQCRSQVAAHREMRNGQTA